MEEVDIKELWNKGKGISSVQAVDVDVIISKKSKTPLYWIKVILWIEFWLNLASLPLTYFFYEEDPILFGIVGPILIVIYLFYYQFLIRKINAFDFAQDVKSGLKKLYGYLNFFFLHYKVIFWISLIIGFIRGFYETPIEEPIEEPLKFWAITIGVSLILLGIAGLVFNFLINLIYGRKIKRLKKIVLEFEEEENGNSEEN
jgi:hypothetical protein